MNTLNKSICDDTFKLTLLETYVICMQILLLSFWIGNFTQYFVETIYNTIFILEIQFLSFIISRYNMIFFVIIII